MASAEAGCGRGGPLPSELGVPGVGAWLRGGEGGLTLFRGSLPRGRSALAGVRDGATLLVGITAGLSVPAAGGTTASLPGRQEGGGGVQLGRGTESGVPLRRGTGSGVLLGLLGRGAADPVDEEGERGSSCAAPDRETLAVTAAELAKLSADLEVGRGTEGGTPGLEAGWWAVFDRGTRAPDAAPLLVDDETLPAPGSALSLVDEAHACFESRDGALAPLLDAARPGLDFLR